ncbi:sugar O-acetyltransferase [Mailhella sp.]|uniref:sugar O-acetyltransferase n=1 Tax=Mailhella sp. TaxID=1981029 RepID=UPI0040629C3B
MTEKEKMLAGMLYSTRPGSDVQAKRELDRARELCALCNRMLPSQDAERLALLRQLLGRTGERFWIGHNFWCDFGSNIVLGEDFFANHDLVILDCAPVTFGRSCFVGPQCGFYTAAHPIHAVQRSVGMQYALPITVGDEVWFGGHVCVMPGVSIGSQSVIGAGSVVTHDIPSGVVAAGNPCRVLRPVSEADILPENVVLRR